MIPYAFYATMNFLASPQGQALGGIARTAAIAAASGGLLGWAGSNVLQTYKISGDQKAQLAQRELEYLLDLEEFEYEKQQDAIGYQQDLEKIHLVGAYDLARQQRSQSMQLQQMQFETEITQAKNAQLALDRAEYLKDTAFEELSQTKELFGQPEPIQQVAYILTELRNLSQTNPPDLGSEDLEIQSGRFFTNAAQ